jgi:hypothetical protein
MQLDNFSFSHYNIKHMYCMCDKGIKQCNVIAVGTLSLIVPVKEKHCILFTFSNIMNHMRNLLKLYFS